MFLWKMVAILWLTDISYIAQHRARFCAKTYLNAIAYRAETNLAQTNWYEQPGLASLNQYATAPQGIKGVQVTLLVVEGHGMPPYWGGSFKTGEREERKFGWAGGPKTLSEWV
jgi:hypothetical protein